DGPAVHGGGAAKSTHEFSKNRDECEREAGDQNVATSKSLQLDLNAHPHEEKRDDERFDRREQLVKAFAFQFFIEEIVENHAGGESADDGSEAGEICDPRQEKSKNHAKKQFEIANAG